MPQTVTGACRTLPEAGRGLADLSDGRRWCGGVDTRRSDRKPGPERGEIALETGRAERRMPRRSGEDRKTTEGGARGAERLGRAGKQSCMDSDAGYTTVGATEHDAGPTEEQLYAAEGRLPPEAVEEFRREREKDKRMLRLQRRPQPSAEELIKMAKENVLARENGYGQALTFVSADSSPRDNSFFMSRYLDLVHDRNSRLTRKKNPRLKNALGQCVDLAAAYVVKAPDWFREASPDDLAFLANKFSRFRRKSTREDALRWVAGALATQMERRDGHRALCPRYVAMVLNAVSKSPGDSECRRVAVVLANGLLDPRVSTQLNTTQVALSLNGLSKWAEDPVCRAAIAKLGERLRLNPALVARLKPREMAMFLNALGRCDDVLDCRSAIVMLGKILRDDPTLVAKLKGPGVVQSLNGLSKCSEDPNCRDALMRLGECLRDDPNLVAGLSPQGVALSLNGLSKCAKRAERAVAPQGLDEACRDAIAKLGSRLRDDPALVAGLSPQGVALSLNGLSKCTQRAERAGAPQGLDEACRDAIGRLGSRLRDDPDLVAGLGPQHVAVSLCGLSKCAEDPICRDAMMKLGKRLRDDPDLVARLSPQGVTLSLSGLSKCAKHVEGAGAPRGLDGACRDAMMKLGERLPMSPLW